MHMKTPQAELKISTTKINKDLKTKFTFIKKKNKICENNMPLAAERDCELQHAKMRFSLFFLFYFLFLRIWYFSYF